MRVNSHEATYDVVRRRCIKYIESMEPEFVPQMHHVQQDFTAIAVITNTMAASPPGKRGPPAATRAACTSLANDSDTR